MSHGHAKRGAHTDTYKSWRYMRDRVRNDPDYAHITICPEWDSFGTFLKDMGEKPEGKTLDRRKNELGYSPANCRWATPVEQANNTTANVRYEWRGVTKTLAEWAAHLGYKYKTLFSRITLYGWSVDRAFTTPVRIDSRNREIK